MRRMIPTKKINILDRMSIQPNGNVNVSGEFTADEIIENISGQYQGYLATNEDWTIENVYTSVAKNGNKLTIVSALNITAKVDTPSAEFIILTIYMPKKIYDKLYPTTIGGADLLSKNKCSLTPSNAYYSTTDCIAYSQKTGPDYAMRYALIIDTTSINNGDKFYVRVEDTFLLGANIVQ